MIRKSITLLSLVLFATSANMHAMKRALPLLANLKARSASQAIAYNNVPRIKALNAKLDYTLYKLNREHEYPDIFLWKESITQTSLACAFLAAVEHKLYAVPVLAMSYGTLYGSLVLPLLTYKAIKQKRAINKLESEKSTLEKEIEALVKENTTTTKQ